jgi:3-hydroxybutyrate dehydrogenase
MPTDPPTHPPDRPACSIVTGGGRGIGRAITLRLARDGPVIVVGRDPANLEAVCAEVASAGNVAAACPGDVSDPATADRAVALAAERGWQVAHLVCNAGIAKGGATAEFDPALWRQIFDVNVHGSFYLVRACLPTMVARGRGTIVLISSLAGVKGVPFDAAYTASKHALVGLARSLALEYGKRGIVAVPICPGFVESDMTRRTIAGIVRRKGVSESDAEAKVAGAHPLRRIMPAQEIAEVVALVCAGTLASVSGNPLILGGT